MDSDEVVVVMAGVMVFGGGGGMAVCNSMDRMCMGDRSGSTNRDGMQTAGDEDMTGAAVWVFLTTAPEALRNHHHYG